MDHLWPGTPRRDQCIITSINETGYLHNNRAAKRFGGTSLIVLSLTDRHADASYTPSIFDFSLEARTLSIFDRVPSDL